MRIEDQIDTQAGRGGDEHYEHFGRQANHWYEWLSLALVFALAFLRTDKLCSLRNLDVVVLLGFLISHGFFRAGELPRRLALVPAAPLPARKDAPYGLRDRRTRRED